MSDLLYEVFYLKDVVALVAVLLIIKIAMDIRDRRKVYRDINNRFDRLHNSLTSIDERLERQLGSQQRRLTLMGDRLERIENFVRAPYRDND